MNDRTYKLREFKNGRYKYFEESSTIFQIEPIRLPENLQEITAYFNYNKLEIPDRLYSLLRQLIEKLQINIEYSSILYLIGASQDFYINNKDGKEINSDLMAKNFETEKKDFAEFLDFTELYVFNKNFKKNISQIKFIQKDTSPYTLKNFFVIEKVYESFITRYKLRNLSPEEFQNRKKELLEGEDINQFKYSKGKQFALSIITKAFNSLIESAEFSSQGQKYRYIGFLLSICQIPVAYDNEIVIANTVEENLKLIETKTIRYFHKNSVDTSI